MLITIRGLADIQGAADIVHPVYFFFGLQPGGDLCRRTLPHPIDKHVSLGIKKNGTPDRIRPEIVIAQPPQGRLQPADDDRNTGEELA